MRDIVSEWGTIRSGLAAEPTISSTNTGVAVSLAGYNGCLVYIFNSAVSSAGTMTPVIQVTDDNAGSANSANWTAVDVADLILWTATSATDFTPVKVGNSQPTVLSHTVALNQRVGYTGLNFTTSGGTVLEAGWIRVVSTIASSWSAPYLVVIGLGRAFKDPAAV